jgi:hypothetical protein
MSSAFKKYDPDHIRTGRTRRHAVDQTDDTLFCLKLRFQDKGVFSISLARLLPWLSKCDPPTAVLFSPRRAAKQAAESKRGRHIQSMEPFVPIRAAVWVSPTNP